MTIYDDGGGGGGGGNNVGQSIPELFSFLSFFQSARSKSGGMQQP
jgi:hypothetical protein